MIISAFILWGIRGLSGKYPAILNISRAGHVGLDVIWQPVRGDLAVHLAASQRRPCCAFGSQSEETLLCIWQPVRGDLAVHLAASQRRPCCAFVNSHFHGAS